MIFAGLFEIDGDNNTNCAILTTHANQQLSGIHHRMPVILESETQEAWLDHGNKDTLSSYDDGLSVWEISKQVNSPKNNSSELLQPVN